MSRFVTGLAVGLVLGIVSASSAGVFRTGAAFQSAWGAAEGAGDSYAYGYVAGVHDLLADMYPPTSHRLRDIADRTTTRILADPEAGKRAAAYYVVGALIDLRMITREDAYRILPETWRLQ